MKLTLVIIRKEDSDGFTKEKREENKRKEQMGGGVVVGRSFYSQIKVCFLYYLITDS